MNSELPCSGTVLLICCNGNNYRERLLDGCEQMQNSTSKASYLHESLNCLMIFETFSNRCGSLCNFLCECDTTRNVALSKRRTSSASIMLANSESEFSSCRTLGIKEYTMELQACGKMHT